MIILREERHLLADAADSAYANAFVSANSS